MNQVLSRRYQLLEQIGSGGMAVIYKAKDLQTDRIVAIKILREEYARDKEFVARFDREARAMQRVRHSSIVEVYALGRSQGRPYIAMEYIDGPTLKGLLRLRGKIPIMQSVQIMLNLCEAIQTAHDNGVIHRDLKPHNILVTPDGEVKITDFGIAKFVGSSTMTMARENVLGSVHYIAPEQASGGETDEKTDIYSLGITMYELLTGTLPFDGDNTVSVAIKHIQQSVPSPQSKNPEISHSLAACVMKACAKDPALRYQTPAILPEIWCALSTIRTAGLPICRKTRKTSPMKSPCSSAPGAMKRRKTQSRKKTFAVFCCCYLPVSQCCLRCL
ncbi:MAG: protein kinase domain-containing protein [Christensenellales bacterium]